MKIEQWFWALLVFSVFMVVPSLMLADINQNYNLNLDTSKFNSTFNYTDTIYNISVDQKNVSLDAETDTTLGFVESSVKGALSAAKKVGKTFGIVSDILKAVAYELKIPSFWIDIAYSAIIILLISMIVYLFIRFSPSG